LDYRTTEHTADVGIEVEAAGLEELFEGAALAMFSIMVDLKGVEQKVERRLLLRSADVEELMFKWLNELIFLCSAEALVFSGFDIQHVGERDIVALARGEPIDPEKHNLGLEIKAATYHELDVERCEGGWFARAIFDV
jgi:SHS2 domain-containing protein